MVQPRLRARFLAGVAIGLIAVAMLGGGVALAADHAVAISGFRVRAAVDARSRSATRSRGRTPTRRRTPATADDGSFDTGTIAQQRVGDGDVLDGRARSPTTARSTRQMTGTITVEAAAGGSGSGATTPPSDTDPAIAAPAEVSLGSLLAHRRRGAGRVRLRPTPFRPRLAHASERRARRWESGAPDPLAALQLLRCDLT